jgi:hypothetical protein
MSSGKSSFNLDNFKVPLKWEDFYRQANVSLASRPVIGFLDQMEFVSGRILMGGSDKLIEESVYKRFRVVHANTRVDKKNVFQKRGLWLISKKNGLPDCN